MKFTFIGIRLIIFDLDGTLINSQPLQYEAFNTIFTQYGHPISREEWIEYWIHKSYTAEKWIEENQLNLDYKEIIVEKRKLYKNLLIKKLEMKPGALELIKKLHLKCPLCVASATHIDAIKMIVEKFDIKKYFAQLISGINVKERKPAPDVFLKVAELTNTNPRNCLVIEDSLAGLKAAKAAGMECIICPDTFTKTPVSEFEGADLIVKNLEEILI